MTASRRLSVCGNSQHKMPNAFQVICSTSALRRLKDASARPFVALSCTRETTAKISG
ncbi:hypothetical protein [Williamsia muralis]|uniref:hypothetical protein n=1 Tax=Williamsia marianensis TaxID=85044 RepID=UPI000EB31BD3